MLIDTAKIIEKIKDLNRYCIGFNSTFPLFVLLDTAIFSYKCNFGDFGR